MRALFATTALGAATMLGAAAHAAEAPGATAVNEVIVTAQKRSENVQHVPISVTAISGAELERQGVQSLSDVARIAPSLAVTSAGPGQNVLIIRGISSTAGSAGTVGYYLDDTPIAADSNASLLALRGLIDPSVFDISRIEVLRGPQGDLYGSSSMGGTIKYVTNQPVLDRYGLQLQATGSATDGGAPNAMGNVLINVPLVKDVLALRASAYYRYQGGFIDQYRIDPTNILAAEPGSPVKKNVNTENTEGFRLQLRFQPDPTLTITPSVMYQYMRLGAPFQIDVPPGSLNSNNLIQTRDVSEVSTQRSMIANVAIHKQFPLFELVSSTSYYDREVKVREDASKVLYYYFSPPQTYVYPDAMTGVYLNKEFTQEIRAASSFSGPFQIIGGVYYHRTFAPLSSTIPDPAGYDAAFGSPFGGEQFYHGVRKATLQESAIFGEASLALGHGVTARAGFRAFEVDQRFYQSGDGVFNGGFSSVTNSSTDRGVNPKFSIDWQIDPDHMVYATASKGYRPGGPNNPAPANVCGADLAALGLSATELVRYNPDTLWNYEVGAKTSWLDRRLTVNGSLYYIDWSQVQQQIVLGCGFNITANFGKAVSKGAELEATFRPIRRLTLSGGFGYTDATLSNSIPGTGAQKGDTLLDVPHWNVSGSAEYTVPLRDDYSAFGRVDVGYISSSHALYDRSSPFYLRKGYTITNLKVGIDSGSTWEAALFVDNVFDVIGETGLPAAISADLPDTRREAITTPRTVGVSVSYKY
ncbi:MAG: TonB-dependent receptor [Caulobacteraceae bacterium]|nr:TonB-dependent receptor [Caulobacteraceae bacterium]